MRPIDIGDTARRLITKAVLSVIKDDIIDVSGPTQLCAGQKSDCETAVHVVHELFQQHGYEAILLVDATNAFNLLNRKTTFHNRTYLSLTAHHP